MRTERTETGVVWQRERLNFPGGNQPPGLPGHRKAEAESVVGDVANVAM
jgi:hypothetical protein